MSATLSERVKKVLETATLREHTSKGSNDEHPYENEFKKGLREEKGRKVLGELTTFNNNGKYNTNYQSDSKLDRKIKFNIQDENTAIIAKDKFYQMQKIREKEDER